MVLRSRHVRKLETLLRQFPVVAILGSRQVGKATLARQLLARRRGPKTLFDLENAEDLFQLQDARLALEPLRGLVVLDEVQRSPEIFSTLRVLVDEPGVHRRFLVLGSAAPDLLRQTSETLAGRIAFHELSGFDLDEVGANEWRSLWERGGYPLSFLARSNAESMRWRRQLIRSYLERDLPELGLRIPAPTMRRFWMMLAHYHGQIWNASELSRAFGVAHTTVRHYLDILSSTFMVRQLIPWYENIGKRQVKAPKVYLRDSGLLHALLGLGSDREIAAHPKVGASWEGFALDTVISHYGLEPEECFYWATYSGAELDLLVVRGGKRYGFEFKRSSSPALTPSMRSSLESLGLNRLYVVHAGSRSFRIGPKIQAVAFSRLTEEIDRL